MLDKHSVVLLGYSGHSYVVIEAAELLKFKLLGYCERYPTLNNPYNLQHLGFEGDETFDWNLADKFILGMGENDIRNKLGNLINSKNKQLLNIIHPTAILSRSTKIGQGNFIGGNVIVNALATIGNYCILNTGCIIEHECTISDAAHIAPGAVLAGNVVVGQNTFVGANAVLNQGVRIEKNVIIGSGTVVLNDIIEPYSTWVGNPAKRIK